MGRGSLLFLGVRDTVPLILAAAPFGFVYGAMASAAGLSVWAAAGMSVLVFAGASQLIAVTLLASAAALPVILLTVFVVNLRHVLYATSLMPHVALLPQWLRLPLAFWLTDETFAVVSNRLLRQPDAPGLPWYFFGSGLAMYCNWVACSVLGYVMSRQLPAVTSWGLDVAMIVAFVGIVIPNLRRHADWACAVTAGVTAILTYHWPHQIGLLFSSVVAIGVAMLLEVKLKRRSVEVSQ